MAEDRLRVYEVVEPMETCNVFLVAATSRADAERRVRENDDDSIISRVRGDVYPKRQQWAVRWLRGWKP